MEDFIGPDADALEALHEIEVQGRPGITSRRKIDAQMAQEQYNKDDTEAKEAYRKSPMSTTYGGLDPEQYDYTEAYREGHRFEADDTGGAPIPNKFIRPSTMAIAGMDINDGHAVFDNGLTGENKQWAKAGLQDIQNSTFNSSGADDFNTDLGLSKVALGYVNEGKTFAEFQVGASSPVSSERQMKRAYAAAETTRDRKEIHKGVVKIGSDVYRHMLENPEAAVKALAQEEANQDLTTDQLSTTPEWISNGKVMYEMYRGTPFDGNDQELSDWVLDQMVWINHQSYSTAKAFTKMFSATQEQGQAFVDLMDIYDRTETDMELFGQILEASVLDPLNLAGIGIEMKLFALASKAGKSAMFKAMVPGMAAGAAEGAVIGSNESALQEQTRVATGEQEGISAGAVAEGGATGAAVGAVVGGALGPAGHAISSVKKGIQSLRSRPDPLMQEFFGGA